METEFPITKTDDFLEFVDNGAVRNKFNGVASESETLKQTLPLAAITLSPQQPRRYFASEAMETLVASIREHGILQPLLVRPLETNDGAYELVAGERRYRAASIIGLDDVPVIIRSLSEQDAFQVSLLENLQREDLNPVEETEAILQLLCFRLDTSSEGIISILNQVANIRKQGSEITNNVIRSQWEKIEQVFNIVGRLTPDSFRSNRLPLLNLPQDVLTALRQGVIEYTKARIIARVKDDKKRKKLLQKAIQENLSLSEIKEHIVDLKPRPPASPRNSFKKLVSKMLKLPTSVWENQAIEGEVNDLLEQLERLSNRFIEKSEH
jgi:ParB family chromosome partitioning protein